MREDDGRMCSYITYFSQNNVGALPTSPYFIFQKISHPLPPPPTPPNLTEVWVIWKNTFFWSSNSLLPQMGNMSTEKQLFWEISDFFKSFFKSKIFCASTCKFFLLNFKYITLQLSKVKKYRKLVISSSFKDWIF